MSSYQQQVKDNTSAIRSLVENSKEINDLVEKITGISQGDYIPIYDSSSGQTRKIDAYNLSVTITPEGIFNTLSDLRAMPLNTVSVDSFVKTYSYTNDSSDGGAIYQRVSSNPGADNGADIIHTTAGEYFLLRANIVNPIMFGAAGDGVTDDKSSLQKMFDYAASNNVSVSMLNKSYYISNTINISGQLRVRGDRCTIITNSAFDVFTSTCTYFYGEHFLFTPSTYASFFKQDSDFEKIIINKTEFDGVADELNNYLLELSDDIAGSEISLSVNSLTNCVLIFGDSNTSDSVIKELNVYKNTSTTPPRWFVRALSSGSQVTFTNINAYSNSVEGINQNVTDKSNSARMFQAQCTGLLNIHYNLLDGAETTLAGNFVYISGGTLKCGNNSVYNVQGTDNTAIIDDKGSYISGQTWHIYNNNFDFSGIVDANRTQAVIRLLNQQDVLIDGNTYRGLKSYASWIYQSVDNGEWPENIVIQNEVIYDTEWPIVYGLFQPLKNITIRNNTVYSMNNVEAHSEMGLSHNRLVALYTTISSDSLDNINIYGNDIYQVTGRFYLFSSYINAVVTTGSINNVKVGRNNIMGSISGSGNAIGYYLTQTDKMTGFVVYNNIGVSGMQVSETNGATALPSDLILFDNIIPDTTSPRYTYKEIEIGDWTMDDTKTKNVAHGLNSNEWPTIRDVQVIIRDDVPVALYDFKSSQLGSITDTEVIDQGITINSTNFVLTRQDDGEFDETQFNSSSYNRGWITFKYKIRD